MSWFFIQMKIQSLNTRLSLSARMATGRAQEMAERAKFLLGDFVRDDDSDFGVILFGLKGGPMPKW